MADIFVSPAFGTGLTGGLVAGYGVAPLDKPWVDRVTSLNVGSSGLDKWGKTLQFELRGVWELAVGWRALDSAAL